MQIDSNVAEADVGAVDGGSECRFHGGRVSDAHVPRQSGAGAQCADHGAERGHLRHRHRGEQCRSEIEAGHDGERFDHHRASRQCLEDQQRALCVIVRPTARHRRRTRKRVHAQRGLAAETGGERRTPSRTTVYVLRRRRSRNRCKSRPGISDGVFYGSARRIEGRRSRRHRHRLGATADARRRQRIRFGGGRGDSNAAR